MTEPRLYRPDLTGCADHDCIINPPTGMGTNGGCSCRREVQRLQPHGFNAVRTIDYLREQLRNAVPAVRNTAPPGYLLVPAEPTPAMIDAAMDAHMPFGDMGLAIQCANSAAPEVPHE